MFRPLRSGRRLSTGLALALAVVATLTVVLIGRQVTTAPAADLTGWNGGPGNVWDGSTSTDWNVAANWSNNAVPTAGQSAGVPASLAGAGVVITNIPTVDVDLSVQDSGSAPAQRLVGATSTTTLGGGAIQSGEFTNVSFSSAVGIGGPVVLNTSTTFGDLNLYSDSSLDVRSGTTTVAGAFVAASGTSTTVHLTDTGASKLALTAPSALIDPTTTFKVVRTGAAPARGLSLPVMTSAEPTAPSFATIEKSYPSGDGGYTTETNTNGDITLTTGLVEFTAPASVKPGDTFTVAAKGLLPNEPSHVVLAYTGAQSGGIVTEKDVTAAADGTASATLTVPATSPLSGTNSNYFLNVAGDTSGSLLRKPFIVALPADTDGDGIIDTADCNVTDKTKPAQGAGVVDANCNGVNDALEPKFLVGTTGNDKLVGGPNADTLKGGAGNDVLLGGAGNDKLDGGVGNDKVDGGTGNDKIAGGAGNDKLLGGTGNDVITGAAGNDAINGGAGKDKASGGAGNDKVVANDKAVDVIACGPGKDAVVADKGDKVAKDCEKVTRR